MDYATAAERLFAIKRFDLAAECYRKALLEWPGHVQYRCRLALILWAGGQKDAAEKEMAHALEVGPESCNAHHAAAQLKRYKGLWAQAAEAARRAIALHPNGDRHHLELSFALDGFGTPEAALDAAKEALRIDPLCVGAHEQCVHLLINLDRDDEAWVFSDALLRLNPDSAYGQSRRGLLHERKKELAAAEERYLAALAIDPGLEWVIKRLAVVRAAAESVIPHSKAAPRPRFSGRELRGLAAVTAVVTWLVARWFLFGAP